MNSLKTQKTQNVTADQTNSRVSLLIHIFTERFNGFFDLIKKYQSTDKESEFWFTNEGADEKIIEAEADIITDLFETMTQGEKNEDVDQLVDHLIEMCNFNNTKYERTYEPFAQNYFEWL
jgi:hypothetical protein